MGVCFSNNNNHKKGSNANGFDFEEVLDNFNFFMNIPEDEKIKIISKEKEYADIHISCKKNKHIWVIFLKEIEKFYSKKEGGLNSLNNMNNQKIYNNHIINYANDNLNNSTNSNNNESPQYNNKNQKFRNKLKTLIELAFTNRKEKLLKNLISGPPNNLRWLVWMEVSQGIINNSNERGPPIINNLNENIFKPKSGKLNTNLKESFYQSLLNKKLSSHLTEQINKDLHRTAPEIKYFQTEIGMKSLFNVLKAYAVYDEEVCYCQGINLITANILLVSDGNESETFHFLVFLFHNLNLRELYKKGFPNVHLYIYIIKKIIKDRLPKIFAKIEEICISDDVWLFKWIQSLYLLPLDFSIVVRIWDCLLAFGFNFIVNITLGFIIYFEKQILVVEDMVEFVYIFKNFALSLNQNNNANISEIIDFREKLINLSIGFKLAEAEIEKYKMEYKNDPNIVNVYYEEGSFYSNANARRENVDNEIENDSKRNSKVKNQYAEKSLFNLENDSFSYKVKVENTVGNWSIEDENVHEKEENIKKIKNINSNYTLERMRDVTLKIEPKFFMDENVFNKYISELNDSSYSRYFNREENANFTYENSNRYNNKYSDTCDKNK